VKPRQKQLALGVLGVAAVLAIAAFPFRTTWWGGWVLAIAEAGIVGGLADWFAVTAIFRRPLGLPIPHTALIPANWEQMAHRVGTMVGTRVLTKDYVQSEIRQVDLAALLARGAQRLTRADLEWATRAVLRWVVEQVPAPTRGDVLPRLRVVLADWRLAPTAARVLEMASEHGWDERVIEALAATLAEALERPAFRAVVSDLVDDLLARYRERMGLYPRFWLGLADVFGLIDRERLVTALRTGVGEIARDPAHPVRREMASAVRELPARLRGDTRVAARVEALKDELLASPIMERLAEEALAALRRGLAADLAAERSDTVAWVVDRLERARRVVTEDAAVRSAVDAWVKTRAVELVERYHARMAAFIENGVRALGAEGAVRMLEEQAGDDLQYIRVNGTVVGGLAGGALHAVHLLARLW
jgi:uncharacterized membrane-anchored protein YjiN (DUF445 family)